MEEEEDDECNSGHLLAAKVLGAVAAFCDSGAVYKMS